MNTTSRRSGFSLIEVLVVVAIAAGVVLVVSNFSNNITGLDVLVNSELQSKSDVSQTLQIMTEEIHSASVSANGAYAIDSATGTSFAFYSDINKNGQAEHVRYFYSTSTIYKGVIAPSGTPPTYPTSSEVITDVVDNAIVTTSSPLFTYYDSSYTGSQSPMAYPIAVQSIRLVKVAFTVQTNTTSTKQKSPLQYFSNLIDLRNLDSN